MAPTFDELKHLQRELDSARALRRWSTDLLRGASERVRAPDAHFDRADAFDCDLWWLLVPLQLDPDGLDRVWWHPDERCAACADRTALRGIWIEYRDDGALIVCCDDERTWVGWRPSGATQALFANSGRWLLRVTVQPPIRPALATWEGSLDGEAWDPPWCRESVLYGDDGGVLAVHQDVVVDDGALSERTLYEQPVDLPDDAALVRRAHDDLVAGCLRALERSDEPLTGAQLWQLHGDDGAFHAYTNFELCRTLDDLLGELQYRSPRLELPTVAPWSRRTYVQALEERLVARGDNDELDTVAIAVVRAVNERLEAAHGPGGPVVLRAVGWLDEESARPGLTDAQWARWLAEDWSSRIAELAEDPGELA